jgi:ribonuclease III
VSGAGQAGPQDGDSSAHAELEERLRYRFRDRAGLRTALTHRSHTHAAGRQNETLEFLGDAVIGLVVSELLVRQWPDANEGQLSRRRAALVNAEALLQKAVEIGLGPLIALGRGEEKTGGREKRSILAGAFEAVLGAVFLDGGFEAARATVAHLFERDVEVAPEAEVSEYKTRLQELSQRLFRTAPEYTLLAVSGPDHARDFASEVSIHGRVLGAGSGQSKKVAEQVAARQALETLRAEAGDAAEPRGSIEAGAARRSADDDGSEGHGS